MTGGCPPVPQYDIFVYFCAHETADEQSHYPPYHERNHGADAVFPLHAVMLLQRQGAAAGGQATQREHAGKTAQLQRHYFTCLCHSRQR